MLDHLAFRLIFLAVTGVVIAVEHRVFALRWQKYELARRTMGVATVLALAAPFAFLKTLDFTTLAWIAAAFGIAGAVTVGLYVDERARENAKARAIAKSEADKLGNCGLGESGGAWDQN